MPVPACAQRTETLLQGNEILLYKQCGDDTAAASAGMHCLSASVLLILAKEVGGVQT